MHLEDALRLIASQQELVRQYQDMQSKQEIIIQTLWDHISLLLKVLLTTDTPHLKEADLLAGLSYAALQAGKHEEALVFANRGLGLASDDESDLIARLMRHLEHAQNGTQP